MANELGNDVALAQAKLVAKILEMLKEMLRNMTDPTLKLKKAEWKQMKATQAMQKYQAKIDKNNGELNFKYFTRSGEKLDTFPTEMSPSEMKEFDAYAKQYNLAYCIAGNKAKEKEIKNLEEEIQKLKDLKESQEYNDLMENADADTQPIDYDSQIDTLQSNLDKLIQERNKVVLIVRAKDVPVLNSVLNRMNYDIMRENEKDKAEDITKEEFEQFNEEEIDNIFESVMKGTADNVKGFDDAVNMVANRDMGPEDKLVICDRNNPDNHIDVSYSKGDYNGRPFTITKFDVYKDGEKQKCDEFSHGEFTHFSKKDRTNSSTHGDSHWQNMKKEMQDKSGMTEQVAIFTSQETYNQYKDYKEKMDSQLNQEGTPKVYDIEFADGRTGHVYTEHMEHLREQTKGFDIEIKDEQRTLLNEKGQTIKVDYDMPKNLKFEYGKKIAMCEQLKLYTELNELNQDLDQHIKNYENVKENPDMAEPIKQDMIKCEVRIEEVKIRINELDNKIKAIDTLQLKNKAMEKAGPEKDASEMKLEDWAREIDDTRLDAGARDDIEQELENDLDEMEM